MLNVANSYNGNHECLGKSSRPTIEAKMIHVFHPFRVVSEDEAVAAEALLCQSVKLVVPPDALLHFRSLVEDAALLEYSMTLHEVHGMQKFLVETRDQLYPCPPSVSYGHVTFQDRSVGFFSNHAKYFKQGGVTHCSQPCGQFGTFLLEVINQRFEGGQFNSLLISKLNAGGSQILQRCAGTCKKQGSVIAYVTCSQRQIEYRGTRGRRSVITFPLKSYSIHHCFGQDFASQYTFHLEKNLEEAPPVYQVEFLVLK